MSSTATRAHFDGPTTPVPARLFMRELDARGIDGTPALQALALTRAMLDDIQLELPWSLCSALVRELCKLVPAGDVDALGVLAGARATLSDLDLAGLHLRSEATVRAAAEFHREHRALFEPSPLTSIYLTDETLVIALTALARTPVEALLTECLLASILTMVQDIVGAVTPVEIQLRHARPQHDDAHRRVLGSALRFGSDIDAVVLPRDVFERSLPHRDDQLRAVLQPHLSRQLEAVQAARADLPTRALLAIRQELSEGTPTAASLAKHLRVSPRSLRRGLRARATTYSALLSQARCELALKYAVEAPRRNGPEIARLLGYADAHTFYRAFRRLTIIVTDFEVAPGAVGEASGECTLAADTQVLSIVGHEHRWGTHVKAERMGDTQEVIFDHDYDPEMVSQPIITDFSLEKPLKVSAGDKLRMTCQWNNTTAAAPTFPTEMCVLFGWQIGADKDAICYGGNWL